MGERRAAHVVVDLLAADREATGTVGHQALPLRGANRRAQVGLARQARFAGSAFGGVQQNDVIARHYAGHASADLLHDARAFVAENHREQPLRIRARARELIGVTDARGLQLDQHLARLRPF